MIATITFFINFCLLCTAQNADISDNSFGKHKDGIIAAFGDFNSDELTDAFVLRNNLTNLVVYLAYDKEPLLRPSYFACNFSDFIITSVVPGDFDGDAYMDILFTTMPSANDTSNEHYARIIWGGNPNLNCSDSMLVKAVSYGQPVVIDYNGDMTLDLFGVNKQRKRVYWVFNKDRSTPEEIPMDDDSLKKLKLPHSHAFLDVNEDNAADLLITTVDSVEVWLNKEPDGFNHNETIGFLVGHSAIIGQAVFLDLSLSGKFHLIMPVCSDSECRQSSTLLIYNNSIWVELEIDLDDGKGTTWRFAPPRNEIYLDSIMIRTGDYNMDGYPDLIMILSPKNSDETRAFLLHNTPCDLPTCKYPRTFNVQWKEFISFGKNVVMATFYDFYMDGVLDIIYVKQNQTSGEYEMNAYRNVLEYDTNFIKVIVSTGLTNKHLPDFNNTFYRGKVTFGTNLPGPKISYSTMTEGRYRTGVCAQIPQSAHFPLQLPYSIFGLTRTPNYIDTLNVGLSGHTKTWLQIIPNSQIVVIPAPPYDPSQWRAQLFVTPSKILVKSLSLIATTLFVISSVAIYLHWKEK